MVMFSIRWACIGIRHEPDGGDNVKEGIQASAWSESLESDFLRERVAPIAGSDGYVIARKPVP